MSDSKSNHKIAILGTGRMGLNLAIVWSSVGYDVCLGSRDENKAKQEAEKLSKSVVKGGKITGKSQVAAAKESDIIVLCTPYPATAPMLSSMKKEVSGRGKIFIDATNPFFSGNGIPKDSKLQSAVQIHQAALGDPKAFWGVAYKTILWTKIVPGSKMETAICGDETARKAISQLVKSHGFVPVDKGDLSNAPSLEPGRK